MSLQVALGEIWSNLLFHMTGAGLCLATAFEDAHW